MMATIKWYTSTATNTYNTFTMTPPRIRYVDFRISDTHDKRLMFVRDSTEIWKYVHLTGAYSFQEYGCSIANFRHSRLDSSVLMKMLCNDKDNIWCYWPKDLIKDMLEYLVKNT